MLVATLDGPHSVQRKADSALEATSSREQSYVYLPERDRLPPIPTRRERGHVIKERRLIGAASACLTSRFGGMLFL